MTATGTTFAWCVNSNTHGGHAVTHTPRSLGVHAVTLTGGLAVTHTPRSLGVHAVTHTGGLAVTHTPRSLGV